LRFIDGGDHIFSRPAPRQLMENVLSEELYARAEGTGEQPGGAFGAATAAERKT
jgi:hypothetical protein